MEVLTEKQIKARAYYAENSEHIKAQKRNKTKKKGYYGRKVVKGRAIVITPSKHRKSKQVALEKRTQSARSKAEDLLDEIKVNQNYYF